MKKLLILLALLIAGASNADPVRFITLGDNVSEVVVRSMVKDPIVLQKPGADGLIAYKALEKGEASFMISSSTALYVAPVTVPAFEGYDPLVKFRPVSVIASVPIVLATSPARFGAVEDVLRSKARLSMGGFGGPTGLCALATKQLARATGLDIAYIPYKSTAQLNSDIVGGHLDLGCVVAPILDAEAAAGFARVLLNLGSHPIDGVPAPTEVGIKGTSPVDIHFILLAGPSVSDGHAMEVLAEMRASVPTVKRIDPFKRYDFIMSSPSETKKIAQQQRRFWSEWKP